MNDVLRSDLNKMSCLWLVPSLVQVMSAASSVTPGLAGLFHRHCRPSTRRAFLRLPAGRTHWQLPLPLCSISPWRCAGLAGDVGCLQFGRAVSGSLAHTWRGCDAAGTAARPVDHVHAKQRAALQRTLLDIHRYVIPWHGEDGPYGHGFSCMAGEYKGV